MKKVASIISSVVLSGTLMCGLVACAPTDEATDTTTVSETQTSNREYSSDVLTEENVAIAQELLSENVSWDVPTAIEAWSMYTTNANDDNPILQAYVWSEDGTHMAYIAYSAKDKTIHGLDSDQENLVPYSQSLTDLL